MTTKPTVLLTGAAGRLGRILAPALAGRGWPLRLTDRVPPPDPLPEGAPFTLADLADAAAIRRLAQGCATILHFGGISGEDAFEAIAEANLRGAVNVWEAARTVGARVVFASSNHATGFHRQDQHLGQDCQFRPDSLYGLSKAFGELLARLYWDKHGIESVLLRIGSCTGLPREARTIATWLADTDLVDLVDAALAAPAVGHTVVWGVSANSTAWWSEDGRRRIGWEPRESADPFAAVVAGRVPSEPVARFCQGGRMCARDYTRAGLPEAELFPP